MPKDRKHNDDRLLTQCAEELVHWQTRIEDLVLRIPTSERRNLVTEANILMQEAVQKLLAAKQK
jgi:hypothetical protein